jgi:hypothetical protein
VFRVIAILPFVLSTTISLPGIGEPVIQNDIQVTLLTAKRLSRDEYFAAREMDGPWAGGGYRFAFVTENRPNAPTPPVLGDVRVLVDSRLYNPVTNATSHKPFAPLVVIRSEPDFFATPYGSPLRALVRGRRASTTAVVLEVFVPGPSVPVGSTGVVELEQGETHRPDSFGVLRALRPDAMMISGINFRFAFPPLP